MLQLALPENDLMLAEVLWSGAVGIAGEPRTIARAVGSTAGQGAPDGTGSEEFVGGGAARGS